MTRKTESDDPTKDRSHALALKVGRAIAARRTALGPGYSQEWLGERVGLSKQTISRIESGRIPSTIYRISQICDVLGCSLGELLDDARRVEGAEALEVLALFSKLDGKQRAAALRIVREFVRAASDVDD
ncbi:helix-turn-helix domain-containing protein [Chitinimonas naiadis]